MKNIFTLLIAVSLISCGSDEPSDKSETAKTEAADQPKIIPGIVAVDVHGNFTNKGFTLKDDIGASSSTWTCTSNDGENDFTVKVFGKATDKIDRVDATVSFTEPNETAKQFIGYAASVKYTGGDPAAATKWALDHFDTGGDTLIGSVKFYLINGAENARVLKLNAQ